VRIVSEREVVITGMGIVSPIGIGREAVWDSIVNRRSGVRRMPEFEDAGWVQPFGGTLPEFDPKGLIEPRKSIKVMSHDIQMSSAAAELAWQEARLGDAACDPERMGVLGAAGVMYCNLDELEGPYQAWLKQEDFDILRWSKNAMGELYPLWMLKYLPNMPACHIGIRYDARGPNNTIASNNVSSILALSEAAEVIRRDQADVMLVAGTGTRIHISWAIWHHSARMARNGKMDPAEICRPFDAERSGMVCGEGAGVFVLEDREHAERRGVKSIARIAGFGTRSQTTDDQCTTSDAIRRTIRVALASAGMEPSDLSHVNAHGLSTREDDAVEARGIHDELGDIPVTAPKSFFGNLGQGSGMVELAVSIMGLEHGVIPPTLNYETPDSECPVNVVTETEPSDKSAFIKLNHNPSGQAAALIVEVP